MSSFRLDPGAARDLDEIWLHIALDNLAAADRMIDDAYASFLLVAQNPHIGKEYESSHPLLAGMRVWHIKGFAHYLIFYRVYQGHVQIVSLSHSSRDIDALLC